MNITRAKQILTSLAGGIDPFTGEVLYENNVCNHGKTIEAINCVLEELGRFEGEYSEIMPENSGSKWTSRDEEQLRNMLSSRASKRQIIKALGRSESGIAARLVRLGLIDSRDEFRRRR